MNESAPQDLATLVAQTHLNDDPLLPDVPLVPGLKCQDHATFVAAELKETAFRQYWAGRGLHAMVPILTERFPAQHIAFSKNPNASSLCEDMIGLSISDDPDSPVNRLVNLYGGWRVNELGKYAVGRLQHVAFAVDHEYEMSDVRAAMTARGVNFMTPILTFHDHESGAYLQQMFVACKVPYGPFVEIIKRGTGNGGEPFRGFNADQIDVLYEHYNAYSMDLAARAHAA